MQGDWDRVIQCIANVKLLKLQPNTSKIFQNWHFITVKEVVWLNGITLLGAVEFRSTMT